MDNYLINKNITARFNGPLVYVLPNDRDRRLPDGGILLRAKLTRYWYAHLYGHAVLVGLPLALPALAASNGLPKALSALIFGLISLLSLIEGIRLLNVRLKQQETPREKRKFKPYDDRLTISLAPALIGLAITNTICFATVLLKSSYPLHFPQDGPDFIANPIFLYSLLAAITPNLVVLLLKPLNYFDLPETSHWHQSLPKKLQRMTRLGIKKPDIPAETWRFLTSHSQIIRSRALFELATRGIASKSKIALGVSLFLWRFSPISYTFIALLITPIFAGVSDHRDFSLAYTLAIVNWSALSLTYFLHFSHSSTAPLRKIYGLDHIHLSWQCRAINLRPDEILDPHVISIISPKNEVLALFLFTVLVPLYLTYISTLG